MKSDILLKPPMSILNPIECYEADNFQYLLIHKNGCSSIINILKNSNLPFSVNNFVKYDKPLFAVIRDPWERIISGLSYDIQRTFGEVNDDIINSIDYHRMFFHPVNTFQRGTGFISHTSLQISYLFDVNPSFYVLLQDLSFFLKLHFKDVNQFHLNKSNSVFKQELIKCLDKNLEVKNTIQKYIAIDNYLIERIKNTEMLWDFAMGKMW